ncbi:NAD-dependent epimerase/dehydratase family protein [Cryptosporangium minutisporangium]|uniref:NAD-dependent epimerase/dehydratase family protein n=1 Tax=Cryptosporangium minutisporangium TaxID=113569 RepID=A0ABP6SPA5_9ACTN
MTGPTGTLGAGLLPLLESDDRVARVVGLARHPVSPDPDSKLTYHQGDVRDPDDLHTAFDGADAVVHLAFVVVRAASPETTRQINIDGTLQAFRAAAAAGARRFVFASSLAAYGFHPDNPVWLTEDWPTRPAARLWYAQEKAELETRLADEAARHPETDVYVVRPCAVAGPRFVGAKGPAWAQRLLSRLRDPSGRVRRLPPLPVPAPAIDVQFVHADDVGQALHRCALGTGPAGAYNLAGDGVVNLAEVARAVGLRPIPIPARVVRPAVRAAMRLPLPGALTWLEFAVRPGFLDTSKAREQLGWAPRYTGLDAIRDTVGQ